MLRQRKARGPRLLFNCHMTDAWIQYSMMIKVYLRQSSSKMNSMKPRNPCIWVMQTKEAIIKSLGVDLSVFTLEIISPSFIITFPV